MGDRSAIEWTDATWNAVTGCTEVSAGCDNCYAREVAHRRLADIYRKTLPVVDTDTNRADPFAVRIWPGRMDQPARWTRPRRIFVNSMSDFFHVEIPEEFQRDMMRVMLDNPRHTYQVLTKRPARAARFFRRNPDLLTGGKIPAHIWIGTSIEDQAAAFRLGQLIAVPARVRFLSCEPLIGPLELRGELDGIHWVIVGGESGANHRPMDAEWVRAIRDACLGGRVAFHFKQWGGRTPKAGGRELDGRTWDEFPDMEASQ